MQYDDLNVVLKEAENERRVVMFLESGKRLVSELVLFYAEQQGATARLNLPAAGLKTDDRGRLTIDRRTAPPCPIFSPPAM